MVRCWSGVPAGVTTDAKVIPLLCRQIASRDDDLAAVEIVRQVANRIAGSMAIAVTGNIRAGEVILMQKGSGQGLFAGRADDGWIFASEAYGVVVLVREAYDLSTNLEAGTVSVLMPNRATITQIESGSSIEMHPEARKIEIFGRDIFKEGYHTFLEKEIAQGPLSVEKTLRGRYSVNRGVLSFDRESGSVWHDLGNLVERGIDTIVVIGQGTAGVAATGIAKLIEADCNWSDKQKISILALRSSEFSAELGRYSLKRALVIAVSQSGTTTDTNRAVDLAREKGAFIHAIVNRRGSSLVNKSNSVLYTSSGRDVEMSVASTKAFYAQIVAGKITSLFLSISLGLMSNEEACREICELEALPDAMRAVISRADQIQSSAALFAPVSRYWAVVGSGFNYVAAAEVRVKLSELCYKAIPVDYTDDKKHIDLSAEPLLLVMATGLERGVVSDTLKESQIFRAHRAEVVVFTDEGEASEGFAGHASSVVALPCVGAGLNIVIAALAGHLFAMYSAQEIDRSAEVLRQLWNRVSGGPKVFSANAAAICETIEGILSTAASGRFNTSLSAKHIASLALILRRIALPKEKTSVSNEEFTEIERVIGELYQEVCRPIDTIRHQAKTVTVGTSRAN